MGDERGRPVLAVALHFGHFKKMTPKWLSVTSPLAPTRKLDVISPLACSNCPSPPSIFQITDPCFSCGSTLEKMYPCPTVLKRSLWRVLPKTIVPVSRNVLSPVNVTCDSKVASSPLMVSKAPLTPCGPTTVRML